MVAIAWAMCTYWRTVTIVVTWAHSWISVAWLWAWTIEIVVMAIALILVSARVAVMLWRLWLVVMTTAVVYWRRWWKHEANIHLSWATSHVGC